MSWASRLAQTSAATTSSSQDKSGTPAQAKARSTPKITPGAIVPETLNVSTVQAPPLGPITTVVLAAWLNDDSFLEVEGGPRTTSTGSSPEDMEDKAIVSDTRNVSSAASSNAAGSRCSEWFEENDSAIQEITAQLPNLDRVVLENTGNTCFLNAALQAFLAVPQCRYWIRKLAALPGDVVNSISPEYPLLAELAHFARACATATEIGQGASDFSKIASNAATSGGAATGVSASSRLQGQPKAAVILPRFYTTLMRASVVIGTQNDASELLLHLIDAWHTELDKLRQAASAIVKCDVEGDDPTLLWNRLHEEVRNCLRCMFAADPEQPPAHGIAAESAMDQAHRVEVCNPHESKIDPDLLPTLQWTRIVESPKLFSALIFAEYRLRAFWDKLTGEEQSSNAGACESSTTEESKSAQPKHCEAPNPEGTSTEVSIQLIASDTVQMPSPLPSKVEKSPSTQHYQKLIDAMKAWILAFSPDRQQSPDVDKITALNAKRAPILTTYESRTICKRFVYSQITSHSDAKARGVVSFVGSIADEGAQWAVDTAGEGDNEAWTEVGANNSSAKRSADVSIAAPTVISKLFSGRLRLSINNRGDAATQKKSQVHYQPYLSIGLTLVSQHSKYGLQTFSCLFSALNAFCSTSTVFSDRGVHSEQRTTIEPPLPPVVFFQLNRFYLDMEGNPAKCTHTVRFPKVMRLSTLQLTGRKSFVPMSSSQYCEPSLPKSISNPEDDAFYVIRAIICHEGSGLTKGHYVCYVPEDSKTASPAMWTKFSDHQVSQVPELTVQSLNNVYVIMYSKWSLPSKNERVSNGGSGSNLKQVYSELRSYLTQLKATAEESIERIRLAAEKEKAEMKSSNGTGETESESKLAAGAIQSRKDANRDKQAAHTKPGSSKRLPNTRTKSNHPQREPTESAKKGSESDRTLAEKSQRGRQQQQPQSQSHHHRERQTPHGQVKAVPRQGIQGGRHGTNAR